MTALMLFNKLVFIDINHMTQSGDNFMKAQKMEEKMWKKNKGMYLQKFLFLVKQ